MDNLSLEQVTRIIEGGRPPRFYKVPVCIIERQVYDAVLNILLITGGALQGFLKIIIDVIDEKKGRLGKFEIVQNELKKFLGKDRTPIENIFIPLKPYTFRMTIEGPSVPDFGDDKKEDQLLLDTFKRTIQLFGEY